MNKEQASPPVPDSQPPGIGIIGMGGFAQSHHRVAHALEAAGHCRLVCTCDPRFDTFEAEADRWELARRGVAVYADYREMLDAHRDDLRLVTVPTPIPLHAPMHRACVERGLACYLEKPPTLYYAELAQMLAEEERARYQTQVAFNFIVEDTRQALKRRILDGEWGRVLRVGFHGHWPRTNAYFTRAPWAGRLLLAGQPVLDSCIGNAMAHYVHNVLFWCGQEGLFSWAEVAGVEAELYRAHAIESFDTCFVRGRCANGIEVQIAATHAGDGPQHHREWVECEAATLTYLTGRTYHIVYKDGREETAPTDRRELLRENFLAYLAYLRGEAPRPLTRLIDARPFVHFYDLVFVAAQTIHAVPDAHIRRSPAREAGAEYAAIDGIDEACDAFFTTGLFPSQQQAAWAGPGGRALAEELPQLLGVVTRMSRESGSIPPS